MRAENGFRITCASDSADIFLYGTIGDEYEGITDLDFAHELKAAKSAKQINLRINSLGGSVFQGYAIYNLLKASSAKITGFVDGVAGSIASVILMAADKIQIAKNGRIMIHNPSGGGAGTAAEHRQLADILDSTRADIIAAYMTRAKISEKQISDFMDIEKVFKADEALAAGLVDKIGTEYAIAACGDIGKLKYKAETAEQLAEIVIAPEPTPEETLSRRIAAMKGREDVIA